MKPILFNQNMVRAILENRKLGTRRPLKINFEKVYKVACLEGKWNEVYGKSLPKHLVKWYAKEKAKSPYQVGDILYVRETWQLLPSGFDEMPPEMNYIYKATHKLSEECTGWRPSLHMPKIAARIFLEVTDVRGICSHKNYKESCGCPDCQNTKQDLDKYSWNANPYVFCYEFKRIDKSEVPNG